METLKSLFSNSRDNRSALEAYADISTSVPYERIVAAIAECFQIELVRSNEYDEYDAYVGEFYGHDVVVLRERDLLDAQPQVYQLAIEPGYDSDAQGMPVDVSSEIGEWLRGKLSALEVNISV